MVLGIVGGSIEIVYSFILIIGGAVVDNSVGFNAIFSLGFVFWLLGILGLIAGGLGLAGGIIIKKKGVMSGIFLKSQNE